MSEDFDPYRKWLGIPPKDQPPNHYRLLGIAHFEDDPDVIENAATRQMVHIRTFQTGKYSAASQKILNELTAAKLCLLQANRKREYDFALRQALEAAGKLSSSAPLDVAAEEETSYPPPPPADFREPQKRWRTGTDVPPTSPELAPVPIPMPPPVAAASAASPVVSVGSRRPSYSASRGRKKSGMPVLLIFCSVAILALAGVVAVIIATQQPSTPPQTKHANPGHQPAPAEKVVTKKPTPAATAFPVGSNQKTSKPPTQPSKPLPVSSRVTPGGDPGPEAIDADPQAELNKARKAIEHRDDGNFKLHISQTEYLIALKKPADADKLKAEEAHLRDVEKLLNSFWQAVREGADKKIPKGEKVSFKQHKLEIVSREGDQLTYKFDDVENTIGIKKLPPRVAMYIALRVFGQDNLDGKIAIVVFQLFDSEANRDAVCQRLAARLIEDIEKAGVSDNPVLVRERSKLVTPADEKEKDLSGPLILGIVAPDKPAASPDKPVESKTSVATKGDSKKLDPLLLKEAREKFDKQFRERMLAATENPAAAKALHTDLTGEVAQAETAELKVKLLREANELAARLGDSGAIVKASKQITDLGGEPALDVQTQLFGRLNLEAAGAAKELLQHARTAAGEAETSGELFQSAELLKIAKKAAEKAGLAAEAKSVDEKLQAIEKARSEKK